MRTEKWALQMFDIVFLIVALGGALFAFAGVQTPGKTAQPEAEQGAAPDPKTDAAASDTRKHRLSYALGANLGISIRKQSVEVDPSLVIQGLQDVLSGRELGLTEHEINVYLTALQNELKAKQITSAAERIVAAKELAEKNKKDGELFLAENKAKEGVVTLKSGLQYKILKASDGERPAINDTAVTHYRGTLIDGTEFDSSYKRNKPVDLALKRVVKGFSEGLQLMPLGSRWQLFIPSNLAYGASGAPGGIIGPNAALVFEVELLAIKRPVADPSAAAKTDKGVVPAVELEEMHLSFKLDSRLTKGLYMGDRWVSPAVYTGVGDGNSLIVDVRANGFDSKKTQIEISPTWIPSDPGMLTVSPSQGSEVKIIVKRAGETSLQVTAPGVSRVLIIKAAYQNGILQAEIAQR
jgi:FKBP-type peptidyl-prolyl cis-trans isomerase FklB